MRALGLIVAIGLLVTGWSAPTSAGMLHAGVKGGVTISNVNVDPQDNEMSDSRTGMALGGFVTFPMTPMISVQPEALFTMKGDKETSGDQTVSYKLNYVEFPVLARIHLAPGAPAHPALYAGPAVGFNTSAKSETTGGSTNAEIDLKDVTKPVDFGFVVGGGVDLPVGAGSHSLGLDLRYTVGLTSIDDSGQDLDMKNGVFTIMGTIGLL